MSFVTPQGGMATQSTVSQIFDQKKLPKWWLSSVTQRFGQNGEQGVDFSMPLNTPIGSIAGGTVKYSAYSGDPSLGYIVQVVTPGGQVFHYQHLSSARVRTGQQVGIGDVIGNSGGVAGQYSTGPHIEVRFSKTFNQALASGSGVTGAFWNDGRWVDPFSTLMSLGNTSGVGGVGILGNTSPQSVQQAQQALQGLSASLPGGPSANNFSASFQLPPVQLGPTADVTQALVAIDTFLELVNPFYVVNIQDVNILGVDTGVQNPIAWLEGFGFNLMADLGALIIRFMLFLLGLWICYKVINHFIDFGALAKNVAEVGMAGLALAAV